MIVRDLEQARRTERCVSAPGWESVRLLLAGDDMGFSFHITTIEPGSQLRFHYKHHFESVYCISGEGSIEECANGKVHRIRPGVMYALDQHDEHVLRAGEAELVLACCFNPPVTGAEVHRTDGSYAPAGEAA